MNRCANAERLSPTRSPSSATVHCRAGSACRSARAALAGDGHAGRVYDLTGPESLTYREALAAIGDAAGRALAYRPITHEQSAANLRAAGVGDRSIIWQRGLYDLIHEGANAVVSDVVERVTGRPARTLAQYAAENAGIWQ
ncbi:MAG: hypothetical protein ACJ786_12420 [Catenulispora sp.]